MKKTQVTIHDIARELNVSASTVSRALADHPRISKSTKDRIRKLAVKLNYSPNVIASSLRRGKGNIIGIIVPNINRHFFSNVIESIEREAGTAGYNVMICQSQEQYLKEVSHVQTMLNARVDGIITSISTETSDFSHFRAVIERGIPLIFFDRVVKSLSVSYVELDDYKGAYEAVSHLIDEGCKRIAFFGGPQHINIYNNRRQGYIDALLEHKLDIQSNIVFENVLNRAKGYEATASLFTSKNPPDAIFSASDFSALGAILYLKENGIRVPEDVAVAGFANEPFTSLTDPSITTVDQQAVKIGRLAASLFLEQVLDEHPFSVIRQEQVQPELIIRQSSVKLNKTATYLTN
ncbi:MAG: LacI family DNA-binding transcriptional regulator [Bacteroidota bacterium]